MGESNLYQFIFEVQLIPAGFNTPLEFLTGFAERENRPEFTAFLGS